MGPVNPSRPNMALCSLAALFRTPRGRLPDFLCLGAQRAGTTALHDLLRQHPEVHLPPEKEVQYFSLHAHRPLRWYASRFGGATSGQRVGDVTPYYLFHPRAPAAIAAALPDARLIVLVRDPVDRALSGYFHARRHGMEPLGLEAAFAAEDDRLGDAERWLLDPGHRHPSHQWHGYVSRSRYAGQLDRFLAHFPTCRLLLVQSEDFFANPHRTWERLQAFLGLPPVPFPDAKMRRNAGLGEATTVGQAFRLHLQERLAGTYDAMRCRFGITWERATSGDSHRAS